MLFRGLIKVNSFLQNNALESIFLISESNLFHSEMVNNQNKLWKSVVLQHKVRKKLGYRCGFYRGGIVAYKQGGNFIKIIVYKHDIPSP